MLYDYISSIPEDLRLRIIWLYIPFVVIILAGIIRSFVKNTLMVTGGVFIFFLLLAIVLVGLKDKGFMLLAIYYYFVSYIGCFVSWIAEIITNAVRNRKKKKL